MFGLIQTCGGFEALKAIDIDWFRKQLLSVKGIGDETADVILLYLLDCKKFISDAYARRVFGRCLGLKFRRYHDMGQYYLENLSVNQLQQFHAMIDELGGNFCKKQPICSLCPLRPLCDFYKANYDSEVLR